MVKQFYRLNFAAAACFALVCIAANASYADDRLSPKLYFEKDLALTAPSISGYYSEEDFIGLYIDHSNSGASVEVWHSLSENSGYTLVGTLPPGEEQFYHYNLKERTVHYYKARAVTSTEMSPFSEVYWQQTMSKNYPPELTVRAINETTVEIKLTDKSYNASYYEINAGEGYILFDTDSGQTKTIYDHPLNPGTTYNYTVNMFPEYDQSAVYNIASASVTTPLPSCSNTGSVEREVWTDIAGGKVSSIPTYLPPNTITTLTSLQAPSNTGNNYGARIRGFLCPPQTGNYTFYISSDDQSELWVSTDAKMETKRLVASVTGYANVGQWDKYPTQTSAPIALTSGKTYYFEVLHKESGSGDHLAVGWKLPNGALERPIGGNRVIKYNRTNYKPFIEIVSPAEQVTLDGPATFTVTTKAYDPDSEISRVEFRLNTQLVATDNTAPYTGDFSNIPAGEYQIWATVFTTDGQTNAFGRTIYVRQSSCVGTGSIKREIWANITGTSVSSVDFTKPPSSYQTLTSFETGQYYSNNYGSRIKGFICVPQTGAYTFWISSDDQSELWLSTNDDINTRRKIASVTGVTKFREYTKYASQKSAPINLIAGRKYYIEALHKEGTGNDFVSVGWQMPDGTMERPIAGSHLIAFEPNPGNQFPTVSITSPADNAVYTAGANIPLKANASDVDGSIYKVEFLINGVVLGEDFSTPFEMTWNNVQAGTYNITARAHDNQGALNSDDTDITVRANSTCSGTGTVYWEKWTGISGTSLSSVPFDTKPNTVTTLTQFGTPNYTGTDYGSRIRAYLCVPVSGSYVFFIASDDASELWLSTDDNPANKVRIAYVTSALKTWSDVSPHRSAPVNLVAGRRYYIEARHKEGTGADFVQVGWQLPDLSYERPIPGSRVSPFEDLSTSATAFNVDETKIGLSEEDEISLFPNPVSQGGVLRIVLSNIDNSPAAVEILSPTGASIERKQVVPSQNELVIPMNGDYKQGFYFVKINAGKRQWVRKLEIR